MSVKNIEEHTAQDYILRELEVTRTDKVSYSITELKALCRLFKGPFCKAVLAVKCRASLDGNTRFLKLAITPPPLHNVKFSPGYDLGSDDRGNHPGTSGTTST